MRRSRSVVTLVIALSAGLIAMLLAARWLNAQGSLTTVKLAIAAQDVPLGASIETEAIKFIEWPRNAIPAGAFQDATALQGRVARLMIARDEPILESRLAPVGAKAGLSAVIAQGKRAITVRVNDVIGVAGFALPGNFVDVILSTQKEGPKDGQNISKIVLENILVLAVGDEAAREETRPKVVKAVTLEVSPQQAEAIDLARSVGQLSLVLRNQVDLASVKTAGITKPRLLGAIEEAPPKPQAMRPTRGECVDVFNGKNVVRQCFD